MKIFEFSCEQWIPKTPEEIFEFFADAYNLELLTPPWMKFEVLTPDPINICEGTVIDYKLRIKGIPMRWQSKISRWDRPHSFVDEQIKGPYKLWIHTHEFKAYNGGTQAADHVRYAVPGGAIVNKYFVANDLNRIFDYRRNAIKQLLT
jgi:ligand-binding SRPBCC domain-containing protein